MSGGGMGGGLGATLGTIAAAALAPETGGASLLVDAGLDAGLAGAITGAGLGSIGGAAGGALGAAVSGGDPGKAAESGGIGGFLGGGLSGVLEGADGADSAIAGTTADSLKAAPEAGVSTPAGVDAATTDASAGVAAPSGVMTGGTGTAGSAGASGSFVPQAGGDVSYSAGAGAGSGSSLPSSVPVGNGASGASGQSGSWWSNNMPSWMGGNSSSAGAAGNNISGNAAAGAAAKQSGGLSQYLMPAGLLLGGVSSLLPSGSNPVNTSNATAAQNQFNSPLTNYNYNRVSTPYSGNWYTYGQRPTTQAMQTNTLQMAKRGGLIKGYAQGGTIRSIPLPLSKMPLRKFDAGGMVPGSGPAMPPGPSPAAGAMMPRPAAMPPGPTGGAPGMAPAAKPNPLLQLLQPGQTPKQNAARYEIGRRIGSAIRQKLMTSTTPDGLVNGPGAGQDDVVPAKLSKDEYVVPADVTSMLGDGSSSAGGKALDSMVHNVRAHKMSKGAKFPPKAKAPTSYMGKK